MDNFDNTQFEAEARKMYQECVESGETSMAAMVPATRVYELVEELEQYLGA